MHAIMSMGSFFAALPQEAHGIRFNAKPEKLSSFEQLLLLGNDCLHAINIKDLSKKEEVATLKPNDFSKHVFLQALIQVSEFQTDWYPRLKAFCGRSGFGGQPVYSHVSDLAKALNPHWSIEVLFIELKKMHTALKSSGDLKRLDTYNIDTWEKRRSDYLAQPPFSAGGVSAGDISAGDDTSARLPSVPAQAITTKEIDVGIYALRQLDHLAGGHALREQIDAVAIRNALTLKAFQENPPGPLQISRVAELLQQTESEVHATLERLLNIKSASDFELKLQLLNSRVQVCSCSSSYLDILMASAQLLVAQTSTAVEPGLTLPERISKSNLPRTSKVFQAPQDVGESAIKVEKASKQNGSRTHQNLSPQKENIEELRGLSLPEALPGRVAASIKILSDLFASSLDPKVEVRASKLDMQLALFVRAVQETPAQRGAFSRLSEKLDWRSMTVDRRLYALFSECEVEDKQQMLRLLRAALLEEPIVGELSSLIELAKRTKVTSPLSSIVASPARGRRVSELTIDSTGPEKQGYDGLSLYFRQNVTPLLSPQEEIELAARIKAGDGEARELFIKANLKLVAKIARDYEGLLPLADLIAEGNIGLMKAVDRFDPAFGAKFSTYGAYWIKQNIRRAISNQSSDVRLPVHVQDKIFKLERTRARLSTELGGPVTNADLALALEWTEEQVEYIENIKPKLSSLDSSSFDDSDKTLGERFADESMHSADDDVSTSECYEIIRTTLKNSDRLDSREKEILELRFGFNDGGEGQTLEAVAVKLGVTRERIRQIQNIALGKLRRQLRNAEVSSESP